MIHRLSQNLHMLTSKMRAPAASPIRCLKNLLQSVRQQQRQLRQPGRIDQPDAGQIKWTASLGLPSGQLVADKAGLLPGGRDVGQIGAAD
jgi:hypothetical protein